MTWRNFFPILAQSVLVLIGLGFGEVAAQDWIRGTGDSLEVRIRGRVFDERGQPLPKSIIEELEWKAELSSRLTPSQIPLKQEADRFEVWIPMRRRSFHGCGISVSTKDGSQYGGESIALTRIRQHAMEELPIRIRPASRKVRVTATHDGKPVENVLIRARATFERTSQREIDSVTNSDGVAQFDCLKGDSVGTIAAWTDTGLVGGYTLYREPVRDPFGAEYRCEMHPARRQVFRCVDPSGNPVPNLRLRVVIATRTYNYFGALPQGELTTGDDGRAVHTHFPDWEQLYCYLELDENWYRVGDLTWDDGIATQVVNRMPERVTITGSLTGEEIAGVAVKHVSFDHPQENRTDNRFSIADASGRFTTRVLPQLTYASVVEDVSVVSPIRKWLSPDREGDQLAQVEELKDLPTEQGIAVQAIVHRGADNEPIEKAGVNFQTNERMRVKSKKYQRFMNWSVGRTTYGWTDENGMVEVKVPKGRLKVRCYHDGESTETERTIDGPLDTPIELHFETLQESGIEFTGKALFAEEPQAGVTVSAISFLDSDVTAKTVTDDSGEFRFEVLSKYVAIYAESADGTRSASAIAVAGGEPIELELKPHESFGGTLNLRDGAPAANHIIEAQAYLKATSRDLLGNGSFGQASFNTWQTKSNHYGEFEFQALPMEVPIMLRALSPGDPTNPEYIDKVYLRPGQSRPVFFATIGEDIPVRKQVEPRSLESTINAWLSDCKRDHYHLLVIGVGESRLAKDAVDEVLMSYEAFRPIAQYLNCYMDWLPELGNKAYCDDRKWTQVESDEVLLAVLNAEGAEIGRLNLDANDPDVSKKFKSFIIEHAPKVPDAAEAWDAAFAEAKRSGRKVWATSGGRYCGPCFMLSRWQGKHREVLEKDFVFVKVDKFLHQNGREIAERITLNRIGGIPFHAIFDGNGIRLSDSLGPLGNIGLPSTFEGVDHLRRMLKSASENVTDREIDAITGDLFE
ncbi:MAG: thioredoxin family protein [Planctomycetota bacterium]